MAVEECSLILILIPLFLFTFSQLGDTPTHHSNTPTAGKSPREITSPRGLVPVKPKVSFDLEAVASPQASVSVSCPQMATTIATDKYRYAIHARRVTARIATDYLHISIHGQRLGVTPDMNCDWNWRLEGS
ncbi:hypothetical protein EX30DRAFT_375112 [Ascodesmis nigricans]|uniref:Ricin B lectin domain-containing protein n=1 Tax=Ascodesmis nigricans TaxID=341454 RepID=A0A4S2MIU1_9PEZI|nr:hypothetical protein EX30DRAFT_375112 [Ascodesmis nigricans]